MAEKMVLVGVVPETMVIGLADHVSWVAGEGQLKVEFDPNAARLVNIFQAPAACKC